VRRRSAGLGEDGEHDVEVDVEVDGAERAPDALLCGVAHARDYSLADDAHVIAGHFIDQNLPEQWAPGTPGACITPPPAPTPRTLILKGGFTVLDPSSATSTTTLAQGHIDLASYLQARCQQQASPAQLASELATTATVVRRLLDAVGITPSPRQVTAAHRRRSSTDQQLAARAAELGFRSLQAYLADRAVTRRWPSTTIAEELGVHPATVGDRLDQHGLPRRRATRRPRRAVQRQRACRAARRKARLVELGFADMEGYLRVRRVGQGWSLRRMLAELQVGSAWLKDQMTRLDIP
jgi:hypothetical protein